MSEIMLVVFLGCLVVFILVVIKLNTSKSPGYINKFPNGTKFNKDTLNRFKEKRRVNNPNNEPVGLSFGRCPRCGSKEIESIKTNSSYPEKIVQICQSCHLLLEK